MKSTAVDLPFLPSLHDTSLPLDATLTDRARSPDAAKRAVLGLWRLSAAARGRDLSLAPVPASPSTIL